MYKRVGGLWEFRGRRYYKGIGVRVIGKGLDRIYIYTYRERRRGVYKGECIYGIGAYAG